MDEPVEHMSAEGLETGEQELPKARAPRKPKQIAVKAVKRSGQAVCVEYDERGWPRRAWVPAEEVREGKIAADVLEAGQPVGIRWEERVTSTLDVQRLARALYRRGMFSADQVAADKPGAMAAIQEAIGPVFLELLKLEE